MKLPVRSIWCDKEPHRWTSEEYHVGPFPSTRRDSIEYKIFTGIHHTTKAKTKTKLYDELYSQKIPSRLRNYKMPTIEQRYAEEIKEQPYISQNKEIRFNNEIIAELSFEFDDLCEEIEESKYILDAFIDEEDEERGKYDLETWEYAIQFIIEYAEFVFDETSNKIDVPEILDGPNGSIDILWRKTNYKMLINIPVNINSQISLYGKDSKNQEIKIKFFQQGFSAAIKYSICSLQCGM